MNFSPSAATMPPLAAALLLSLSGAAHAVDLTVQSLNVIQAVQYGSTRLIGGNVTMVRAKIGITGSAGAVGNVDAVLRMYVGGIEAPGSPVFSVNGPISAPLSADLANLNDTVNFLVLPPVSTDVDFIVEVNPTHALAETSFANNSLSLNNQAFECRTVVELVYVPIDYTPSGVGPPPDNLLEPGIGDGFVRAIYTPGEWNYHRSPLPPLVWSSSIGSSSNSLLTTLRDIRINQIPAADYPEPPFVFGWLPGNPYSGNGKAIGIPGDVAFGNTEIGRHQRTFAHELGHLVGLQHTSASIDTVGVDVEHHLWDTQDLAQVFTADKKDIMVAGLLTHQAFVRDFAYNKFLDDARTQCPPAALAPPLSVGPVLRVAGIVSTPGLGAERQVLDFMPVTRIDRGQVARHDPEGDLLVVGYDAAGAEVLRVGQKTGTTAELCGEHAAGRPAVDPQSPFHLLVPESVGGSLVHRIELIDRATGQVLAQRQRSANPPVVAVTSVASLDGGPVFGGGGRPAPPGGKAGDELQPPIVGRTRIDWAGSDPDGDPLSYTVLYSPSNGDSWLPLIVNTTATTFEFDTADVPASSGLQGVIRVSASDGLNHGEGSLGPMALGAGSPPLVYLITPNDGDLMLQHAPVAFHAAAWDLEDLMLDGSSLQWTSSINGPIGSGRLFMKSTLSPGTHTITVTGTDSSLRAASKSITLVIQPRQITSPDLNGDGVVNGLDIAIMLGQWGPCPPPPGGGGCPADLNFSGTVNGLDLAILLGSWG